MGLVMPALRGRVEGAAVARALSEPPPKGHAHDRRRILQRIPGRGPGRAARASGPGLERRRDQDRPGASHGHHPAPLRDGRPPPHRAEAPHRLQHRHRCRLASRPSRSAAARKPTTRSRRRSSPTTRRSRASSCSARAGRSPAGSTTGPARSSRPSRPGELYGSVPELADICNLETEKLFGVFSENMGPEQWIAHGQGDRPGDREGRPGHRHRPRHRHDAPHGGHSRRSWSRTRPCPSSWSAPSAPSDRPSSDAALNLMHSVKTAAESDIAEVMVCMFGPTSDHVRPAAPRAPACARCTRATARRSGRSATSRSPWSSREKITPLRQDYKRRRADRNVVINTVVRGEGEHRLLLSEHEAGHHRLAHRQRLPGHRHRRARDWATSTSRSIPRSSAPGTRTSPST